MCSKVNTFSASIWKPLTLIVWFDRPIDCWFIHSSIHSLALIWFDIVSFVFPTTSFLIVTVLLINGVNPVCGVGMIAIRRWNFSCEHTQAHAQNTHTHTHTHTHTQLNLSSLLCRVPVIFNSIYCDVRTVRLICKYIINIICHNIYLVCSKLLLDFVIFCLFQNAEIKSNKIICARTHTHTQITHTHIHVGTRTHTRTRTHIGTRTHTYIQFNYSIQFYFIFQQNTN